MALAGRGETVVLSFSRLVALFLLAAVAALTSTPGAAHKDHEKQAAAQAPAEVADPHESTLGAMREMREDHTEASEEQAPKTFPGRLINWIGRFHPFAVHFPIALFPVALVALILARRRGETVELIRALIVVAGAGSVVAAILGWFTAGFAMVDPDAVHLWHRWIGTGLAVMGASVAVWALKGRSSVYGRKMVVMLAAITVLLLVQGWLGAALVHGMDHMSF